MSTQTGMTSKEALAALDALYPTCRRCLTLRVNLMAAIGDRNHVARKAARDTRGYWSPQLEQRTRDLAVTIEHAAFHLAEPHAAPEVVERSTPAPAVVVVDDRPECPRCGTRVQINATTGRMRAHRGRSGTACPRRVFHTDVKADLPPVVIPAAPNRAPRTPSGSTEPSRLDAGSTCKDCGKWLPGERELCGRCYVHRDQERSA